jgi:hypothetical protein
MLPVETTDLGDGYSVTRSDEGLVVRFPAAIRVARAIPFAYGLVAAASLVGAFALVPGIMCLPGPVLLLFVLCLGAQPLRRPCLQALQSLEVRTDGDGYRDARRRRIVVDGNRTFDEGEVQRIVVVRYPPYGGATIHRVALVLPGGVVDFPGSTGEARAQALARHLAGALDRDPGAGAPILEGHLKAELPWTVLLLVAFGATFGSSLLLAVLASVCPLPLASLGVLCATIALSRAYLAFVRRVHILDDVAALRDTFGVHVELSDP